MAWLIIINEHDNVDILETDESSLKSFNFLPTEDNLPISFGTYDAAVDFIKNEVDLKHISQRLPELEVFVKSRKYFKK